MTKLCSPIMTDTFFTIPPDSSLVALRNWRSCRDSFDDGLDKRGSKTDYTQYGLHSQAFPIMTADGQLYRYCVPTDHPQPDLHLKNFKDVCPDQNGKLL